MDDAFGIGGSRLDDDDVGVLAVATVGRVGEPASVAGPAGADVARFPVRQPMRLRLGVGEILEVELVVLVPADVRRIEEERAAGLHLAALHGLGAAREGRPLGQGRLHQVEVRSLADPGRHERRPARGVPAAEAGAAEVQVRRELGRQRRRHGRDAFGDDGGRDGGPDDDRAQEEGEQGGAAHVISLL